MRSFDVTIPVSADESVSGVLVVPQGFEAGRTAAVIVAHGAGNDMHTPLLVHFSAGLCRAGYLGLRFNFPYKEKGRKAPDPQEKLVRTWQAAFEFVIPMLFFAGTRNTLCDLELLKTVVSRLKAPADLEVVEEGDHSFVLAKSFKSSEEAVYESILLRTVAWLKQTIRG